MSDFAAHYQRSYPRLAAIAAGVLGERDGAEDIVQQAASIAAEKGKRFDSPGAWVAWMIGVVRRCAQNERRKMQRRRTFAADPIAFAEHPAPERLAPCPVEEATGRLVDGQQCFEDSLQQALQELSEEARCCLLLRTVHGMEYAEISELLGIRAGTAMSHVHRSRGKLREFLGSKTSPQSVDH